MYLFSQNQQSKILYNVTSYTYIIIDKARKVGFTNKINTRKYIKQSNELFTITIMGYLDSLKSSSLQTVSSRLNIVVGLCQWAI